MRLFIGFFVWGLILAAPLAWLASRLHLPRLLPHVGLLAGRARAAHLPPQLAPLLIRGQRRYDFGDRQ